MVDCVAKDRLAQSSLYSQSMTVPLALDAAHSAEHNSTASYQSEFASAPCEHVLPDLLSFSDVQDRVASEFRLNAEQLQAFKITCSVVFDHHVLHKSNIEPLCMFLTGPGGTGKTYVVNAVKHVMEYYQLDHCVQSIAPTGTTASLIDGSTIHNGLGIRVCSLDKGRGNRKPGEDSEDLSVLVSVKSKLKLHKEWKDVVLLLIDEVSLLDVALLGKVDAAL